MFIQLLIWGVVFSTWCRYQLTRCCDERTFYRLAGQGTYIAGASHYVLRHTLHQFVFLFKYPHVFYHFVFWKIFILLRSFIYYDKKFDNYEEETRRHLIKHTFVNIKRSYAKHAWMKQKFQNQYETLHMVMEWYHATCNFTICLLKYCILNLLNSAHNLISQKSKTTTFKDRTFTFST